MPKRECQGAAKNGRDLPDSERLRPTIFTDWARALPCISIEPADITSVPLIIQGVWSIVLEVWRCEFTRSSSHLKQPLALICPIDQVCQRWVMTSTAHTQLPVLSFCYWPGSHFSSQSFLSLRENGILDQGFVNDDLCIDHECKSCLPCNVAHFGLAIGLTCTYYFDLLP